MNDKDLNYLAATKIMGWVLSEDGIWLTPEGKVPTGLPVYREPVNATSNFVLKQLLWDPLTDMNQCFKVVAAKLVKDGWGWAIEHTVVHKELKAEIYKDSDFDTPEELQENAKHYACEYYEDISDLNRAFLTAALRVKGVEV